MPKKHVKCLDSGMLKTYNIGIDTIRYVFFHKSRIAVLEAEFRSFMSRKISLKSELIKFVCL